MLNLIAPAVPLDLTGQPSKLGRLQLKCVPSDRPNFRSISPPNYFPDRTDMKSNVSCFIRPIHFKPFFPNLVISIANQFGAAISCCTSSVNMTAFMKQMQQ